MGSFSGLDRHGDCYCANEDGADEEENECWPEPSPELSATHGFQYPFSLAHHLAELST
tara:strand:+ start:386 stop:559 length:174 start_codon:yes stop_codon:yes gene_type:complete